MKRVIIIGGNGSGKTTFSVKLSEYLNLPLLHLDNIFWKDDWKRISQNEFDNILIQELEKAKWIIDGNYNRTLIQRLKYCDTVFYFDFSTLSCLTGVISRYIKNYGKCRYDVGANIPEKFSLKFYCDVILFNKKYRKKYYKILNEQENKEIIIFKNRKQVNNYLKNLINQ